MTPDSPAATAAAPGPGPSAATLRWHDIEADPKGWDDLVADLDLGAFHRAEMLAAHRYGRSRRRGIVVERDGRPVAALGGLHTDATPARFESLAFPPRATEGGGDLPGRLIAWLAGEGVGAVAFGSFDGGVEGYEEVPGARYTERLEFPWRLPGTEDAVRASLRSNHRRKLAKLATTGAALQTIPRRQAAVLTRMQGHFDERRGGGRGLRARLRAHRFHRRVHRHLGRTGLATLYGLYDGPTLLSVAYMIECGDRAFYMMGASSGAGYRVGASVALFVGLAVQYAGRGIHELNLGGVPGEAEKTGHEENGVYRFKIGFGIRPEARRSLAWDAGGGGG